ncbi:MAG: hypothetical protein IPI87_00935 [Betaproteobacteria bacterium]|nr:hypothetical protein [Betaproteobacteria bacterium]
MSIDDARKQPPAGGTEWLDIRVGELRQLFNAMDPAPFRERDIDPNAETYIVDWAQEVRAGRALGLVVHLARERAAPQAESMLRESVDDYFRRRAVATRARLRRLFRVGRVSLVIGLAFLVVALALGEFLAELLSQESWSWVAKESLVIGGWVALWRPLEIFLYDWWPIRAEARMYDRLGEMDVRLVDAAASTAEAAA